MHNNRMFKRNPLVSVIYILASIFLITSSYTYFINKDYWQLFINIEFLIILIYMNFIYKKYPLKLTQSFISIGFLHFIGYGINAFLNNEMIKLLISLILIIIALIYLIRPRKKKYPIYFNPKIKWSFFLGICFER